MLTPCSSKGGCQAPAANHKGSQKALESTFLLTNISPQVGKGFNRQIPDSKRRLSVSFIKKSSLSGGNLTGLSMAGTTGLGSSDF